MLGMTQIVGNDPMTVQGMRNGMNRFGDSLPQTTWNLPGPLAKTWLS